MKKILLGIDSGTLTQQAFKRVLGGFVRERQQLVAHFPDSVARIKELDACILCCKACLAHQENVK
jgi:hypothetical protein